MYARVNKLMLLLPAPASKRAKPLPIHWIKKMRVVNFV